MDSTFPEPHRETLALLEQMASVSACVTMRHYRNNPPTEAKGSGALYDPVTAADRDAETALRALLADLRPDDTIIGEEHGETQGTSDWTWYLDPIDGTRAYVAGLTSWTTLIGLAGADGMPVYGMIDCPALGERYLGWPGGAALLTREGQTPLRVSDCEDLREARISTTDPFIFTPAEEGAWTHLRATARIARYGLDAYAYARLGGGTIDLVAESGLRPWDAAALIPVVRGAGGLATNWRGEPATAAGGQLLCCASVGIQEQALLALRRSAL